MADRMSPEQRAARGKRLAEAYHKRLKDGLAERVPLGRSVEVTG